MLPVLTQLAGALLAAAGLYLLFGTGVALLAAGVALVAVGALAELQPRGRRGSRERYTS